MTKWFLLYPLLILLLFGIAIYVQVSSAALSLPISRALTILAILLPVIAVANAIVYSRLVRQTHRQRVVAFSLQAIQAILTTVLATLLLSNAVPSAARTCLLTTTWQHLFSSHDAGAIRRIQDAFDCCGCNTVKDRAWPWLRAGGCAETYHRDTACLGPWQVALQQQAGIDFGVVLAVGLFQLASLFFSTSFHSGYPASPSNRFLHSRVDADAERARLLPAATAASYQDNPDNGQEDGNRYEGLVTQDEPANNPWGSEHGQPA
ncbi:hypothetical protein CDD82_3684 [Ophiocordyceps australis]|uniref:Tetraspanin Tsp3 n=1 Tax=Ophiocordyceps australis TaxID=1399860 RepID=A0A2C5ZAK8_9HYPO|nr:hypothetical protein CDD82_3684 [Ophiocordyceps australis]